MSKLMYLITLYSVNALAAVQAEETSMFVRFMREHRMQFNLGVDIALLLLAGYHWFRYIDNWKKEDAVKNIMAPLALTILAFTWPEFTKIHLA